MMFRDINAAYFVLFLLFFAGLAWSQLDERLAIVQDGSVVIKVGEKRLISCGGTAKDIEWLDVNGRVVGGRSPRARVHVESIRDQKVLMFNDPNMSDNGTWTCRAGDLNKTIDVYFVEEVKFINPTREVDTAEGARAELACEASGIPKPELVWYRDMQPITGTDNNTQADKYKLYEDGRLFIMRVSRNDSGEYECRAHQKVAAAYYHVYSTNTLLRVMHAPILEHDTLQELFAIVNETKVLRCAATAYPKPTYKWKSEENSWTEEMSQSVVTAEDGSYSEFTLRVKESDLKDKYSCTAFNKQGRTKTTYHLTLGNKPEPPELVEFESATNDSMSFQVTCEKCPLPDTTSAAAPDPEHLPVTKYLFELINSTDDKVDWEASKDNIITVELERLSNGTAYKVKGLQPLTTYQIRVASVNAAGNSEYLPVNPQKTVSLATGLAAVPSLMALVLLHMVLNLQSISWHCGK